jgi:hypothetical protein
MEYSAINNLKETAAILRHQADVIEKMIVKLAELPPPRTGPEYPKKEYLEETDCVIATH